MTGYSRLTALNGMVLLGCIISAGAQDLALPQGLDLDAPLAIGNVASQLAGKRVVFIGETHDRYDHHLNQLEMIRRLHQLDSNLAIGVEYLPAQVQSEVDNYVQGRSTEDQFLRATDYYRNWGYDYRLYAPIFRFAREQRIPVRALNVPAGLASAVAKVGIQGLSEQQRAELPEIQPADEAYRARLRSAFEEHQDRTPGAFERFVEAQLVWDEGMATSAAEYLNQNQGRRMVILAGAGHIAFGSGIPGRLERRIHAGYAIILNSGEAIEPKIADYFLLSEKQQLPSAGVLGVSLEDVGGQCRVRSVVPAGAAAEAGIKQGDVLIGVDGQQVRTSGDVKVALWNKRPADRVAVRVQRKRKTLTFEVGLGASKAG